MQQYLQGFAPGMGKAWPSSPCCCGLLQPTARLENTRLLISGENKTFLK